MSADNRNQRNGAGEAASAEAQKQQRTAKPSRADRLAAELRGNLRKRKALARTRGERLQGEEEND